MHWDINVKTWDEFPDAQRWFAVGECMSHLERLGTEGRIIKETDGMLLDITPYRAAQTKTNRRTSTVCLFVIR